MFKFHKKLIKVRRYFKTISNFILINHTIVFNSPHILNTIKWVKKEVIINHIESTLLNFKLITKTLRGRQLTIKGDEYLLKYNENPFK